MKKNKELHIISFNIPYPANYGGVIDVFYKLIALKELGIKIHLHCFKYGRKESIELEKYCEKVYYYDRKMNWQNLISTNPFIIQSRTSDILVDRLSKKPFPILLEGLHCAKILCQDRLKNQKKYIRTHNIETDYYRLLAKTEHNFFKKIYLYFEYLKVANYEKRISEFNGVFPISISDHNYFKSIAKSHFLRAFHSNPTIQSKIGIGKYALYHGNLTISENENAAFFLINKVFNQIDFDLVITGKKPSFKLRKECEKYPHIQLIESPKDDEMNSLVENAQCILLPTEQNTGIKLKLIESLYKGRFCIGNNKMIDKTELEDYCLEANSPQEWINQIKQVKDLEFSKNNIKQRQSICSLFNNKKEAQKIIDIIFE